MAYEYKCRLCLVVSFRCDCVCLVVWLCIWLLWDRVLPDHLRVVVVVYILYYICTYIANDGNDGNDDYVNNDDDFKLIYMSVTIVYNNFLYNFVAIFLVQTKKKWKITNWRTIWKAIPFFFQTFLLFRFLLIYSSKNNRIKAICRYYLYICTIL